MTLIVTIKGIVHIAREWCHIPFRSCLAAHEVNTIIFHGLIQFLLRYSNKIRGGSTL